MSLKEDVWILTLRVSAQRKMDVVTTTPVTACLQR